MTWTPESEGSLEWRVLASDVEPGVPLTVWPAAVGPDLDTVGGAPRAGVVSTVNGSPMVSFNAVTQDLLGAALVVPQPWTFIAFGRQTDTNLAFAGFRVANVDYVHRRSSSWRARSGGVVDLADASPSVGDVVWIVAADGAASFVSVAGLTNTGTLSNGVTDITLGSFRRTGANVWASCAVAEAAVFSAGLSGRAADIAAYFTAAYVTPPAGPAPQTGWGGLLSVLEEREVERRRPPVQASCPNDGTVLVPGPDGRLFCRYDGWSPTAWDAGL
jgi:hypothetical protein